MFHPAKLPNLAPAFSCIWKSGKVLRSSWELPINCSEVAPIDTQCIYFTPLCLEPERLVESSPPPLTPSARDKPDFPELSWSFYGSLCLRDYGLFSPSAAKTRLTVFLHSPAKRWERVKFTPPWHKTGSSRSSKWSHPQKIISPDYVGAFSPHAHNNSPYVHDNLLW